MARVRVGERAVLRVKNPEQQGHEHGPLVFLSEQVVHLGQRFARGEGAHGVPPDQSPADHHEKSRRYALARNIRHDDAEFVPGEVEDIVEVPTDILRRSHDRVRFGRRGGREPLRQDGHLHVAGDPKLLMKREKLSPMLEGLAHHGEVGHRLLDGEFEIPEVDGLRDEVESAPVHRGPDVRHVAVCRHHHRPALGADGAQLVQQGQTVHPRHVDVGHDELDFRMAFEGFERLDAVLGEDEVQLVLADPAAKPLADQRFEIGFVVDHQDRAGIDHESEIISLLSEPPGRSSLWARWRERREWRGGRLTNAREGGIPGVFRPKRNEEGREAARWLFGRDGSPLEPPPGEMFMIGPVGSPRRA